VQRLFVVTSIDRPQIVISSRLPYCGKLAPPVNLTSTAQVVKPGMPPAPAVARSSRAPGLTWRLPDAWKAYPDRPADHGMGRVGRAGKIGNRMGQGPQGAKQLTCRIDG
jgi:hypothetical protein